MAFTPISLITIQYQNPSDNTPYSGAVLKAYAAGTSTNIVMATDSTGATTFTSVALNSSGNPEHLGATIIPHIDQAYKMALYANQAAADADTPSVWSIDNLLPLTISGSFTTNDAISGAVTDVLEMTHTTTGTPTTGIGTGISFTTETAIDNNETGMTLDAVTTDISDASEDFDFVVNLMAGGATAAEVFRVTSAGVVTASGTSFDPGGISYVTKTTTYTTQSLEGVLADTSGAAFTITLPASPSSGDQVVIADSGGAFATNNLTVGRNSETIDGTAADLVLNIDSVSVQFVYDGTTWQVYAQIGGNSGTVVTEAGVQTLTNKVINGSNNTITNVSLTAGVTGALPIANGGTNLTSYTAGDLPYASATNVLSSLAKGTAAQVLTMNAGATAPEWAAAAAGGSLVWISNATASSSATIEFTGIDSTYDEYVIKLLNIAPATDGAGINMRTSSDNGTSYDSGASDYNRVIQEGANSGTQNDAEFPICENLGNGTGEYYSGTVQLIRPSEATYTAMIAMGGFLNLNGDARTDINYAVRKSAADVDAFQFIMTTGNIASGLFSLYGVKRS